MDGRVLARLSERVNGLAGDELALGENDLYNVGVVVGAEDGLKLLLGWPLEDSLGAWGRKRISAGVTATIASEQRTLSRVEDIERVDDADERDRLVTANPLLSG